MIEIIKPELNSEKIIRRVKSRFKRKKLFTKMFRKELRNFLYHYTINGKKKGWNDLESNPSKTLRLTGIQGRFRYLNFPVYFNADSGQLSLEETKFRTLVFATVSLQELQKSSKFCELLDIEKIKLKMNERVYIGLVQNNFAIGKLGDFVNLDRLIDLIEEEVRKQSEGTLVLCELKKLEMLNAFIGKEEYLRAQESTLQSWPHEFVTESVLLKHLRQSLKKNASGGYDALYPNFHNLVRSEYLIFWDLLLPIASEFGLKIRR